MSKEDDDFFGALGRLTISWARIEFGLDCAIDVVHQFLGGKNITSTAPKISLYRKIEYLRKWGNTVPEATFRDALPPLLTEIETASVTRHDLIHGVIIKMEGGTGEAEMARIIHHHKSARPPFEKKYYKFTTGEILRAAVAADRLSTRSIAVARGLQDLLPVLAQILKKPDGEVGS
jgi:hypothetical protein